MRKYIIILGYLFVTLFQVNASQASPLITLPLGQEELSLSQYKGQVILLDFWASWCGPCRQSFPWMNEIQARYADQGLLIIAINLDKSQQDAEKFLREVPAEFKIEFDPSGASAEKMQVLGMPMSYLIDREGNLRHRFIGFNNKSKDTHEEEIRTILNEKVKN